MSLIKYHSFPSLRDVQEEINRVFSGKFLSKTDDKSIVSTSEWSPHADLVEKKDCYTVLADIPGVDPKEINDHARQHIDD